MASDWNEIPAEERFHENVMGLTDLIYDLVDDVHKRGFQIVNPTLIIICKNILIKYSKIKIIEAFIKYSHKYWDQIHDKDRCESYITEHAMDIFKELPMNNVNAFKELFEVKDNQGNRIITQEDRDAIRDFFVSFIKIAIDYIHVHREPVIFVEPNGTKTPAYANPNFCDFVEIEHHAELWNVKLKFENIVK